MPFPRNIMDDYLILFTNVKCKGKTQITYMEETEKRHQVIRLIPLTWSYAYALYFKSIFTVSYKVILVLTQPCADSCVVIKAQESVLPIAEH